MKVFRKRGTRSSVALFSIAALALAMTGILYAHWTDTLEAQGVVETGSIDPLWTEQGTSDDGIDDTTWDDAEPRPAPAYTYPGRQLGPSSSDQTWDGTEVVLTQPPKDVATCGVFLFDQTQEPGDEDDFLVIIIENGYPSYYCLVRADLHNEGTVPVKLQGISFTLDGVPVDVFPGPSEDGFQYYLDTNPDGDTDVEIEFGWETLPEGVLGCGFQLDPGDEVLIDAEFHVDQDALQNHVYEIGIEYQWVNWNEYEDGACPEGILNGE